MILACLTTKNQATKMEFTNSEKYDMLECFIRNNNNSHAASETYLNRYPERRQPHKSIFMRLQQNLINYGSFKKIRPKKYNVQSAENAAIDVIGAVIADPSISSRQIEVDSGISRRRALTILKKNKFKPYAIRKRQQLLEGDCQRRLQFCMWFEHQCLRDASFARNIIWTDESYISSNGIFNRHNNHYWSDVNPHQNVDIQSQGRFGFSVWCALLGNRVLAYEIYQGTLNSERYHQILSDNIINYMDQIPLMERSQYYFQQDGAPPHNTRAISELLSTNFGDKVIATNGPVRWPPRSPDLTPLDFFLWGYIKNRLYNKRNRNVIQLRQNFEECLRSVSNIHMLNAINVVRKKCNLCIQNNGGQFENLT